VLADSQGGVERLARKCHRVAVRKRAVDIVLGTLLSILALPVIAVLAVGVAFSLRAWPFFVQVRPGWRGQSFTIVKLRTLPVETSAYMDKHTLGLDTLKLPWLCSLMRRTHLDELPQLFLVVSGHMSLIGPRPPLPTHVEPLDGRYEALRRSIRPGCTGLWQLSVASTDTATSAPRFDLLYLHQASMRMDAWILVRTIGWILGIAAPIEVADIPRWALGPGLLEERVVHSFGDSRAAEADAPAGPIYATEEPMYPRTVRPPLLTNPNLEGMFAEVGD
jgi:lipopolysaccharide/colanic/teichoic acid biosynthesis glycosyltransferase